MSSSLPTVFYNDIGSCAYNSVLIGLFSLKSFNKGVKNYLYKHVNKILLQQIEDNVDVLYTDIILKHKTILYFEFILLCYYIIAKKAEHEKSIYSSNIKIFVLYIIIICSKYSLDMCKTSTIFIKEHFESKFNLALVDEANDSFYKYFSTIKEMSTFKTCYGAWGFTLLKNFLFIFEIAYKRKKNKKTRDMYNMIYKLFFINNTDGFLFYNIDNDLQYVKTKLKTSSILIIFNNYSNVLGVKIDNCENSKVDTTDKNYIKTVFKFPEFINSKNHKLVLKAKFLHSVMENIHHSEIIIRYFKDNKYYRINNHIAIKCDSNNDIRNYYPENNKYYVSTCNSHKCFDNFTEFVIYEVV